MKKEPASNVYVCSNPDCLHIWRTSAKNPICSKCNNESPRTASPEEKTAFNRRQKKKPAEPQKRGYKKKLTPESSPGAEAAPAIQEEAQQQQPEVSNPDINEFVTPAYVKPEFKKIEDQQPGNVAPVDQQQKQPKKYFNFGMKGMIILGGFFGIAAGLYIVIKKAGRVQPEISEPGIIQDDIERENLPLDSVTVDNSLYSSPAGFA